MKKGFACGMFDVFHPGHVLMLKECKEHCDYLMIGLNTAENISNEINPGKNKPIFSFEERKLVLSSCKYVDEIVKYTSEDELIELLTNSNLDVRFLGDDYKGEKITGPDIPLHIHYIDRSHGYSTSKCLQWIREKETA
jgi:glycerol-3-phosphate cytidylyltransferase